MWGGGSKYMAMFFKSQSYHSAVLPSEEKQIWAENSTCVLSASL